MKKKLVGMKMKMKMRKKVVVDLNEVKNELVYVVE